MCVCANGLVVCDSTGARCAAFPRIYNDRLRSSVRTAVHKVAFEAHTAAWRTGGEVGGDILARRATTGPWDIAAILCLNTNSTELRSDPSCKLRRVCANQDPRRGESHVSVGEFHTHPGHGPWVRTRQPILVPASISRTTSNPAPTATCTARGPRAAGRVTNC